MTRDPAPDQHRRRRARLVLFAFALAGLAFAGGTILAPVLESAGHASGGWLRVLYAPACHQLADRSLTLAGGVQAVCARCAGLYAGGVLGLLAGALWLGGGARRPRPAWLWLAFAPTAIDLLLPWVGLPGLANLPRLLLAVPAGAAAGLFLAAGLAEIARATRPRVDRHRIHNAIPALEDLDG